MPKQFVALTGILSSFQQTLERVADRSRFARPIVITNTDFRFIVAEQLREIGVEADIVLEPTRRESGPAVAAAAALSQQLDPASAIVMLAADHMVRKPQEFVRACDAALPAVMAGRIVTFGIHPTKPSTAYGYIRTGAPLSEPGVLAVDAFFEKPDAEHAAEYVAKSYLWNSGNFAFRSDVMLQEIAKYEPNIASAARAAVAGLNRDLGFLRLAAEPFAAAPKKSIDHAVMERTALAAVVPVEMGWSDIGSWDAVWENVAHDSDGNNLAGAVTTIDSHNNLIRSDDGILTAVIGIEDAVVVTTADAVLIIAKSRAEDVKILVERLNAQKMRVAVEHRRMFRPWGYYQGVDTGARYQVKRIVVKPAERLSLQKHFHRAEHWVVVRGTAEVTLGEDVSIVHENESIYIPIGSKHRLSNPGKIPLELIEVQVGSYLGEDDIERFEDTYGRGP